MAAVSCKDLTCKEMARGRQGLWRCDAAVDTCDTRALVRLATCASGRVLCLRPDCHVERSVFRGGTAKGVAACVALKTLRAETRVRFFEAVGLKKVARVCKA